MSKTLQFFPSVFLLLILFGFFVCPVELFPQDKASDIDKLVTKTYENREFNGSILVAEKGEIIYKKSFGYANREWKIPNTPDTKFRIASVTKQFTSMLIMQLVEEGKIELQGKISQYLPKYRKDIGNKVTIQHLLTHTSGIPAFTSLPGFKSDSIRLSYSKEYMVYHFLSPDLEFEPGSRKSYSNGYSLLAAIIEQVTGKSYRENLQERIFTPLKMWSSGAERNEEIIENRATGYIKDSTGYKNTPYIYMRIACGDGDMYSTVEDLYLWDQALYTEKLLSEGSKEIMFAPNNMYGWNALKVGLRESSDSVFAYWKRGSLFGFNSIIIRFVEDRHLIVVLLNNKGSIDLKTTLSQGLCYEIINILYDRPYQLPEN
jgi:CubicO group peptidase (beta-lactamase class C family)